MNAKFLAGATGLAALLAGAAGANATVYSLGALNNTVAYFPTGLSTVKNGTVTDYFTFTLSDSELFFSSASVTGPKGKMSFGLFELFSGTPTSGTAVVIAGNPDECVSVAACSAKFLGGGYAFALGDDEGWTLAPGAYYVEAMFTTTGLAAGQNALPYTGSVSVTSVPEASTWAMLGLGFAAVGLVGFHSRRTSRYTF